MEDGTLVTTKDGEIVTVEPVAEVVDEMGKKMIDNPAKMEKGAESPAEEGADAVSPVEDKTAAEQGKMNPEAMGEMYDMLKEFVTKCGAKMAEMEGQYNALQNEFNAFKKEPAGNK